MAYDISALKSDLSAAIHGTTLNKISNINGLIYRAARTVLEDVDPQETKRIVALANPIFNSVYNYALPVDLKGNKIIDIRPQVNRQASDLYGQLYNQDFDINKLRSLSDSFTINFNGSLKTVRINAPTLTAPTSINQCDGVTTNGTWTTGGGASAIATDNVNYVSGAGSISFNLNNGQATGYVENSTMTPLDLTAFLNQGSLFFYVYLPSGSAVTAVELRFGSSSTNYYSQTVTATHEGLAFQTGWNLLRCDWASTATSGTPVVTAVKYARITFTYNSVLQTAVRLDNIMIALGTILECEYYSKYLFRDVSSGAYQETVTADSNLINLDTDSFNLLFYKFGELAVQQIQGLDALFFDNNFFEEHYQESLARYRGKYKSEVQKPKSTYYSQPNPSYRKYFGRFSR